MAHIEFCGGWAVLIAILAVLVITYSFWITSKIFALSDIIRRQKSKIVNLKNENSVLSGQISFFKGKDRWVE